MLTVASSGLFLLSAYLFYTFSDLCISFYILQYLLLTVFVTSTIFHYFNGEPKFKYGNILTITDKTLAKIITLICFYNIICIQDILSFLCLVYVCVLWYFLLRDQPLQPCLHCSIHIVANLGVMSYLYKFLNIN